MNKEFMCCTVWPINNFLMIFLICSVHGQVKLYLLNPASKAPNSMPRVLVLTPWSSAKCYSLVLPAACLGLSVMGLPHQLGKITDCLFTWLRGHQTAYICVMSHRIKTTLLSCISRCSKWQI